MKYYDGHESVYAKIEKNGGKSWADRTGGQGLEVEHAKLKPLLEQVFSTVKFSGSPLDAMDLGCGTGTVSGYLAKQGFRTYGIDVSASAIHLAQRLAVENGLTDARFAVADIVNYPDPAPTFDLIVDSHCLHCLVFDRDRTNALMNIRRLLKPGGVFVVDTKTSGAEKGMDEKFHLDETGILWFETGQKIFDESKQMGDRWYMPQRRILPPEALRQELIAAGLTIQWSRADSQTFSAICINGGLVK